MLIEQFSDNLPHASFNNDRWQVRVFGQFFWKQRSAGASQFLQAVLKNGQVNPEALGDADGAFIGLVIDKLQNCAWVFNDPLGNRRAHFLLHGNRLWISDRPAHLLPALAGKGPIRLKRSRLSEHFAASSASGDGCFFADIQALLPGHWLKAEKTPSGNASPVGCMHLSSQPYYRLTASKFWPNLKQPTAQTVAIKWRQQLEQATAMLMEPHGIAQTAVSLSGGLDSGLIAGLLARRGQPHQATALSYTFAHFPDADESQWLRQYNSLPLRQFVFDASDLLPLATDKTNEAEEVLPDAPTSTPYRALKTALYRHSKSQGCSLLLTGIFADHLYSGWIYHGMDRWRNNPLQAVALATRSGPGLRAKLAPLAPGKWKRPVRVKRNWLQPQAQQLLNRSLPWPESHGQHPHPQQAALVAGLYTADSFWLEDIHARRAGIQLAHPFRQRPVVEWLMQQPGWLLGDAQQPKRLARQAAQGLLPAAIVQRRQTRSLVSFFVSGVLLANGQRARQLLNDSNCRWPEFVQASFIHDILEQPQKPRPESHYVALWQCLAFEMWRNRLEQGFGRVDIG